MKKVIITGASRGIGQEIAKSFLDIGFDVYGTSTSKKNLNHRFTDWIISDFSKIDQIELCANKIEKLKPDILINNAGINKIDKFHMIDKETFLKIHQINVFAPFLFCQRSILNMKKKKWGRIVNITSIWSKVAKPKRASYMASKFALDGITKALSAEYSKYNVLSNCIAPGVTKTDLTKNTLGTSGMRSISREIPINRLAEPKEVSELVLWLASDKNTYITGQNILIDGGYTTV